APDHGLTMEGLSARAALLACGPARPGACAASGSRCHVKAAVEERGMSQPIEIYVDADACPVKAEVYRVAERYGLKVFVVSNSPIAIPREPWIERVVV